MASTAKNLDVDVSVPEDIESSSAKLVWLWLAINDAGTSEQISQAIDEPLLKVFPILSLLREKGAIKAESTENSTVFVARHDSR